MTLTIHHLVPVPRLEIKLPKLVKQPDGSYLVGYWIRTDVPQGYKQLVTRFGAKVYA